VSFVRFRAPETKTEDLMQDQYYHTYKFETVNLIKKNAFRQLTTTNLKEIFYVIGIASGYITKSLLGSTQSY
jgi:hypothetical protein